MGNVSLGCLTYLARSEILTRGGMTFETMEFIACKEIVILKIADSPRVHCAFFFFFFELLTNAYLHERQAKSCSRRCLFI